MSDLQASDFRQFFFELHGKNPFPWQESLAEKVCTGDWPEVIDLPTASGKTACIDIALFALALRGPEAPRRIFFVVDRRVVVSEAYLRMKQIRDKLCQAETGVLGVVAAKLKELAGGQRPLKVYEMRGGAFRDETWVKDPLQPTVVASTVDQVGSRLFFRGYGVSENSWPLHAGLIANDALIILDEAHCSRAFAQTLQRVQEYRGGSWAEDPIHTPFQFVEMTATPSPGRGEPFRITSADRGNEVFAQRIQAGRPTRLVEAKGKKDDFGKLADELISQAVELAKEVQAKRVAILVNRVRTAKIVHTKLREMAKDASVELVIGRMRAIDRDDLYERKLQLLKSGTKRQPEDPLTFVVSTQCLEVGADLDFDVLVSECASIDALQQRFGRLDRLGDFEKARGAIVIGSWQVNPKQVDPVYGESLSKTWEYLKNIAADKAEIDMGIEAVDGRPSTVPQLLKTVDSIPMRLQLENAPILLPAHMDAFAQTSPTPEPDPSVELFLHGPEYSQPDVQVLWRADLEKESRKPAVEWTEIVKLCPPSSRETMPVPIGTFKKWFSGRRSPDDRESDLPIGVDEEELSRNSGIRALSWRGEAGDLIDDVSKIRPGQTIILPVSVGGWSEFGYIPDGNPKDVGDRAAFDVRRGVSLRLHPEITKEWPQTPVLKTVQEYAAESDAELNVIEERLAAYREELENADKLWPYEFFKQLGELRRKQLNTYPSLDFPYVLHARRPGTSRVANGRILLEKHLCEVEKKVKSLASGVSDELQETLRIAARFHDYGKADVRFQAWLLGGDIMAARYAPKPIAKSGDEPLGKQEAAGLPKGFRHELLSLMFAEKSDLRQETRDLILHLIASHHGRCRPIPPLILDERAECVSYGDISICKEERATKAPHRLDSGIPDRFWKLTRKYGWWGLAYLEALLRLADWQASEGEVSEVSND